MAAGAKVQYLKCGVAENVKPERLVGGFKVAVQGQPDQEISVQISILSDYRS
jgi:hypothetical protein